MTTRTIYSYSDGSYESYEVRFLCTTRELAEEYITKVARSIYEKQLKESRPIPNWFNPLYHAHTAPSFEAWLEYWKLEHYDRIGFVEEFGLWDEIPPLEDDR